MLKLITLIAIIFLYLINFQVGSFCVETKKLFVIFLLLCMKITNKCYCQNSFRMTLSRKLNKVVVYWPVS